MIGHKFREELKTVPPETVAKWWFKPLLFLSVLWYFLLKPIGLIIAIIFAICFWIVIGSVVLKVGGEFLNKVMPTANPTVMEEHCKGDTRIVNNQFDFGYNIELKVKNVADKEGNVKVEVGLSCSEGEWHRIQTLSFQAGETQDLEYFFQEPTINATNIQYSYKVVAVPD